MRNPLGAKASLPIHSFLFDVLVRLVSRRRREARSSTLVLQRAGLPCCCSALVGRRNLEPSYGDAWFPGSLASDLLTVCMPWLRPFCSRACVTAPRARMNRDVTW